MRTEGARKGMLEKWKNGKEKSEEGTEDEV